MLKKQKLRTIMIFMNIEVVCDNNRILFYTIIQLYFVIPSGFNLNDIHVQAWDINRFTN